MLEPEQRALAASVNPSSPAASSSRWSWLSGMDIVAPPRAPARDGCDGRRHAAERESARRGRGGEGEGSAASSAGSLARLPCRAWTSCRRSRGRRALPHAARHDLTDGRLRARKDFPDRRGAATRWMLQVDAAGGARRLVDWGLGRDACDAMRNLSRAMAATPWLGTIGPGLVMMGGRHRRPADKVRGWGRVCRCACCAD